MVGYALSGSGKLTDEQMTRGELRALIATAPLYKFSLGRSARFREEALAEDVMVFESEVGFHDAVIKGDEAEILRRGRLVRAPNYRWGNAPESAVRNWRAAIETFETLPEGSLVLNWVAEDRRLLWGISGGPVMRVREQLDDLGQRAVLFHRPLLDGWRQASVRGVPLTNLHPKAQDYAINQGTLNRIVTDEGYFRALLRGEGTASWEGQPAWLEEAKKVGWRRVDLTPHLAAGRSTTVTPQVVEIADHLEAEVKRMAATAFHTVANANGQTVETVVKYKGTGFDTREDLEDEITDLLKRQMRRCALTGYDFDRPTANPHLKPSLDRKDSALGYEAGNLQVVTRAANFYKSASDDADWALKAKALTSMAIAMQERKKGASTPTKA